MYEHESIMHKYIYTHTYVCVCKRAVYVFWSVPSCTEPYTVVEALVADWAVPADQKQAQRSVL